MMEGKQVYASLDKFPKIFDKVTVNIIKASEEAGTLATVLKQIKENMQKEIEFNDKVKSALMYPAFVLVVFFGVLFMIFIVVVPKISTVFSQLKIKLPLATKIMIFFSDLILKSTVPLVIGLSLFVAIFFFLLKTQKKKFMQLIFSLPLISNLVEKIDLTKMTRSMYMLLNSGILITGALDLVQDIVINKHIAAMLKYSKTTVSSGKNFSEALKKYKQYIPSLMIKIIEAGEKSGSLEKSFLEVSEYLDYEVSRTLKTLTALLEPVMLVAVGIMVGGMMLSIIGPIYGMIGQIGQR
jgi:type II secretory pathway component PulF